MKFHWPKSLRVRLTLLVAISTLPAILVMTYNAFERYYTSVNYAYGVSRLAGDDLAARYQALSSRSSDVLAVMAQLPAINAPVPECNGALAALHTSMPLYTNLGVVSLDGQFRCSAVSFARPLNVADRDWFRQVLAARRFTSGVIPHGHVSQRSLLIFSAPHFDAQGNLAGTLNAVVSPEVLKPPADEPELARYGEITVFSADGTVLLRYPTTDRFVGSDQSRSPLFRVLQTPTPENSRRSLTGLGGETRVFALRRIPTDVPNQPLLIASGISQAMLRNLAFLPLARDLGIIVGIALFVTLMTWWFTTVFVTRRMRALLKTLQNISVGDWNARSGLATADGEFGSLARGVDEMAEKLQAQVLAEHASKHAHTVSELRYKLLVEQAVEGITVRHVTGEYILANKAFCKMLGYSRDELLRMRITDLIDPVEQRGHLLQPGESAQFESWMYHRDGHRVPMEVTTLKLPNGDIQSVQRDIHERLEAHRALQESEHHYRELVEQSLFGILIRRVTGEILFVNRTLCQMTGYRREELVGMDISRLTDPTAAEALQRLKRLTRGETAQLRSRLVHKDGHIIHEELSARRLEDGNLQVIISDITARVETEQHLADERQFTLQALDVLPGVFYVFDAEGHFLRWNRGMEQATGYNAEEMQQITSADIVPPERRGTHVRLVHETLSGTGTQGETELYCKDGTRVPYYYVAQRLIWQEKNCVVGMGVDISALKQTQQTLQAQQQLLDEAINSLPGLFTLCTDRGRFLLWNQRLQQLSGYSAEQLRELKPLDLIAPEHRELVTEHIREVFASGQSEVEAEFLCRDGRRIPHFFTARRLQQRGEPTLVGVALDISERREVEQRAQNYLEELQQLSERLLRSQEEERRHLAGELHDEMGQGLLTVLLGLQDLENRAPANDRTKVARIRTLAGELAERVRALSLDMRPAMLDDLGLAATMRWYLRERVAPSGVQVDLDMDPDLPRLPATTEITCFRLLQAALTNTVKHAAAHKISVSLRAQEDALLLVVQDDGCGFDVKAARRRALAGGSFGLLGMEKRVQLARGYFDIHSTPGRGTRIQMVLPMRPPPEKPQFSAGSDANHA